VLDVARDLVRLAGRDPDSQPITTIGLRPGEKLHEELFYDAETVEPTQSPKVLRAISSPPPLDVVDEVKRFLAMASGADEPALRRALLDYVRGVEPTAPVAPPVATSWLAPVASLRLDVIPATLEIGAP